MTLPRIGAIARPLSGLALLAALLLPPLRHALESSMSLRMLVQYPALMLAGTLLAGGVPTGVRRWLAAWNALGISGFAAVALFLAVLMIPRVLDLALADLRVEAAKVAALLFAGAALHPSWRAAGRVVQGFCLGNLLPMMVIVGTLYQDSPLRLCNAYRLDDQQQLGQALVWVASVVAIVWLAHVSWRLSMATTGAELDSPRGGDVLGMTSRSVSASDSRRSAVLPSRKSPSSDRPDLPTTMRSAAASRLFCSVSSAGRPTATVVRVRCAGRVAAKFQRRCRLAVVAR
jgi:hypothetical protein